MLKRVDAASLTAGEGREASSEEADAMQGSARPGVARFQEDCQGRHPAQAHRRLRRHCQRHRGGDGRRIPLLQHPGRQPAQGRGGEPARHDARLRARPAGGRAVGRIRHHCGSSEPCGSGPGRIPVLQDAPEHPGQSRPTGRHRGRPRGRRQAQGRGRPAQRQRRPARHRRRREVRDRRQAHAARGQCHRRPSPARRQDRPTCRRRQFQPDRWACARPATARIARRTRPSWSASPTRTWWFSRAFPSSGSRATCCSAS